MNKTELCSPPPIYSPSLALGHLTVPDSFPYPRAPAHHLFNSFYLTVLPCATHLKAPQTYHTSCAPSSFTLSQLATPDAPTLKRKPSITSSIEDSLRRQRIRSESPTYDGQHQPLSMPTDDENMNAPPPRTLPAIVRTYNGVTTLDNGQQYTHPPVGGFPNAHLTESVWRNTTDFSRLENKAEPGPKAWARPYRGSALQDLQATSATLTAVMRKLTGDPNIKAIAPVPKAKLDERYPPPYHYLIVDGDAPAIDRLVRMGTWATPDATFLTENFDVPLSSYLVTLEGFTGPDCTETNDAIASAISAKLLSLQPIVDFLIQNSETAASYTGNIAHDVINSISVYSLRMAKSKTEFYYVWNVYAHPPQMTRENWMIFNGMVRSHIFEVRRLGLGTPRIGENQFKCTGCKSSDHPTGLCPLPTIPGWFGPALSSIADDDKTLSTSDNNHHLSSPTPARGNGRGRGRGGSRSRGWGSRIFRPY